MQPRDQPVAMDDRDGFRERERERERKRRGFRDARFVGEYDDDGKRYLIRKTFSSSFLNSTYKLPLCHILLMPSVA